VYDMRVQSPGLLGPGACSEFPNDNPALHHGAIWGCEETLGPATCARREIEVEADVPEEIAVAVAEPVAVADAVADADPPAESIPDPVNAPEDPFATLLRLLEEVARASGSHDDTAVALRATLGETRITPTSFSPTATEALVAGQCLEQTSTGIKRTELFTLRVLAWQGILRGEGEDFAACGSATLDEWAADLLGRCMGTPALTPALRRELRNRGVAAFGLVAQAA
jgi:hypothetical protein